jgi:uncharacterized protein
VRFDEHVIAEFRANTERGGGWLAQSPVVPIHHVRDGVRDPARLPALCGGLVIVASNGGSPADPAWCHNLTAHPRIGVEVGAEAFTERARELDDDARARLWPATLAVADTGLTLADDGAPRISLGHNVASKEEAGAVMEQARRAGATIVKEPADTFYGGCAGCFQDLDRHLWEIVWNPALQPADLEGRS